MAKRDRHSVKRRLRGTAFSLLTVVLLSPSGSVAQTPSPEAELNYIGSVELRPDRGELSAGWTIEILDGTLDKIEFALSASFGTAVVSGRSVADLEVRMDLTSGETIRLYKIDLHPADGKTPRRVKLAYGGPLRPMTFNALSAEHVELTGDSRWFPVEPGFAHRLTTQLSLHVPGSWTVLGIEQQVSNGVGIVIRQTRPAFDIAVALLKGDTRSELDNYTVHDARSEPGTNWAALEDALSGCRAFLNGVVGETDPLPDASILLTDRPDGAYSRGTLLSLMDIENEMDEQLYKLVCHELSHHWSAASPGGPEDWINEGLAEYLALMAIRDRFGDASYQAYLNEFSEALSGEDLPPIWTPNLIGRTSSFVSYRTAPLLLAELETRMGTEVFAKWLRSVLTERIGTTAELLNSLEAISGRDVRLWFERALATGYGSQ